MDSEAWEQQNDAIPSNMNQDVDGDCDAEGMHGQYDSEHNGNGAVSQQHDEQRAAGTRQSGETEQHRKLFVGGLSFKTEEESLKSFFSQYGEVVDCVVMRDGTTKRPRGFGFITYASVSQVDEAQKHRPHVIDGKTVETKRAMPKEESERPDSHVTTKRMWVGGVAETSSEAELRDHFTQYGSVQSVELVTDKATGRPRGFAFVNFDDYDAVDKAILAKPHMVGNSGRPLEVRKALSRAEMDQVRAGRGGSGGGRGMGRRGAAGAGAYGPPAGPYGYPAYGAGSYGHYGGPKRGSGRGRGGSSYGGNSGYSSYSSYPQYGAYSDYGGYEYGGHGGQGHGWSGESAGRGGNWPGEGASFGAGYSQYDAGGPMRGSSQYSQRSAGPYGGYSGGYGGGYGAGGRR